LGSGNLQSDHRTLVQAQTSQRSSYPDTPWKKKWSAWTLFNVSSFPLLEVRRSGMKAAGFRGVRHQVLSLLSSRDNDGLSWKTSGSSTKSSSVTGVYIRGGGVSGCCIFPWRTRAISQPTG
jgi:hypothetical protein